MGEKVFVSALSVAAAAVTLWIRPGAWPGSAGLDFPCPVSDVTAAFRVLLVLAALLAGSLPWVAGRSALRGVVLFAAGGAALVLAAGLVHELLPAPFGDLVRSGHWAAVKPTASLLTLFVVVALATRAGPGSPLGLTGVGLALAVAGLHAANLQGLGAEVPLLLDAHDLPLPAGVSLTLLLLGVALALACGVLDRFDRLLFLRVPDPQAVLSPAELRWRRGLRLAGVGALIVFGFVIHTLFRNELLRQRAGVERSLAGLARLKVDEIETWRSRRARDVRLLGALPRLAEKVAALARDPGGPEGAAFAGYLNSLRAAHGHEAVAVLDADLRVLFVSPAGGAHDQFALPGGPAALAAAHDVIRGGFERHVDGNTCYDLTLPVRAPDREQLLGAIVVRINAHALLVPLVEQGADELHTAEAYLIRREGDEVVFLTGLRFRRDRGAASRLPLGQPGLLAAQMVLHPGAGLRAGVDYRNVPALAVAQPLPGTDLQLAIKIDQSEAYAKIRREALQFTLLIGLAATTAALIAAGLARVRQRNLEAQARAAIRERQQASERLDLVLRQANDVILLFDEHQQVIEASDRCTRVYGWTPQEMTRLKLPDLRPDIRPDRPSTEFARVFAGEELLFEAVHRRKDGSLFPVEVNSRTVTIEGRRYALSVIRDVTQRRERDREIERLNFMYQVTSQLNRVIAKDRTRPELLQDICDVLIATGRFKIAWVGWHDPATRQISPVAIAGDKYGYVPQIRATSDSTQPLGHGPAARAIRDGRPSVFNDFFAEPSTRPWHDHARRAGFNACLALPLSESGPTAGVLLVYAAEKHFFGPREIAVLEEVGRDISHALGVLATEEQFRAASDTLRKLSLAVEQSPATILITDLTGAIEYANTRFTETSGYTLDEVRGKNPRLLKSGLTDPAVYADLWQTISAGRSWRGELINRHKDGGTYIEMVLIRPLKDADGKITHYVGLKEDITERKRVETALRESEERYRLIAENTFDTIWVADLATGCYTYVSPSVRQLRGYDPAELIGRPAVDFATPAYRAKALAAMPGRIAAFNAGQGGGRYFTDEADLLHKDGHVITVEIVTTIMPDATGRAARLLGVSRDITARRRAERELRRLSAIVEQAPLTVVITDLTGAIEYVNPRFTEATGYTFAEVRGQNPRILKSGETPPEVYAEMWRVLGRREVWRGELHNRRKDGTTYLERAVIAPLVGENGEVTHYAALKEDITQARRTEQALLERQERYRVITENTSDVIWIYDLESDRFTYLNPATESLLGYPPAEIVGQGLSRVLTPASAAQVRDALPARIAAFEQGDPAGRNRTILLDHVHRDGQVVRTETVTTLLADARGHATQLIGVSRDVTARERAAEEVRLSRDRLAIAEEIARLGSWSVDHQSGRNVWSPQMHRILECDPDATPAHELLLSCVHPEDREKVNRTYRQSINRRIRFFQGFRLSLAGGRIKYVEATGESTYDDRGQPLRTIGTLQDVTERKLVELELYELVKELRVFRAVSLVLEQKELSLAETLQRIADQVPGALRTPQHAQAEIRLDDLRVQAGVAGVRAEELSVPLVINGRLAGAVVAGYVRPQESAAGAVPAALPAEERERIATIARTLSLGLSERESFARLRLSEERFRAIFDHAEVGMFETSPDGRITRANNFLGQLIGVPPAELVGRSWTSFVANREAGPAAPSLAPERRRCARADGRSFFGLFHARAELDAKGQTIGYICLLQDISEQVAAHETLLRFNAELEDKVAQRTTELATRNREVQALLRAIPDVVMQLTHDGLAINYQPAPAGSALAALPDAVDPQLSALPPALKEACLEVGRRALAANTTATLEATVPLAAGEVAVELRAAPVGGDDFVVFLRDITGRKRHEAESAAMLAREREVSEMKTRFISVTSHEFRTPMAAALGSVELLNNHFERLSGEKRKELLGRISFALQRMTEMLDEVLLLSRLDTKRLVMQVEPVDLHRLLRTAIDEARLGCRESHRFELTGATADLRVDSDVRHLHHIFANLLSNAVRYSPAGSRVGVALLPAIDRVEVAIDDQGIGVPAADRERIFEPFERGSNVGVIKGTGLGLNIVKRMAEMLGAAIRVEDAPGGGSRFILSIPRRHQRPTL